MRMNKEGRNKRIENEGSLLPLIDMVWPAIIYTVNEGPLRIQYRCLVLIYVFPETKLRSLVISETEL
jgi:hypothetical protein